ncbi:HlyD family efflux transporter periplasmic adaptor subunit [Streptomyces sp. NPDC059072]|uniref:HlyD family efflux transporter periplasmic adaptor subunit n=1 Tax=Streptomyces sp. NPDC059072 TaxID=3346715 RepID=UPI0036904109
MHDDAQDTRGTLTGRRRWVAGAVGGALALMVAGLAAGTFVKSPAQVAAETTPPPADVLTAAVENKVLRETLLVRGTITAEQSVEVAPAVGAEGAKEGVVTKAPRTSGEAVSPGQLLLEVSGRPILALKGKVPAYRDLRPGARGADVTQLQKALADAGHRVGADPDGVFGPGTKQALTSLYQAAGYEPRPSDEAAGAGGGGPAVDSEGSVRAAQRAYEDAAAAAAAPGADKAARQKQAERAREDLATARKVLEEQREKSGPMLPAGEVVFLSAFPARVDTLTVHVGSKPTGSAMRLSTGPLIVQGYLKDHQVKQVKPGQVVDIQVDGTQQAVQGEVLSVAQDKTGKSDNKQVAGQPDGQAAGYLFTVRPRQPLNASLAGQEARLVITTETTQTPVLAVPVSAVTAGADGSTTITMHGNAGRLQRIRVNTGTEGDGYVQITPAEAGDITPGTQVIVGIRSDGGNRGDTK